MHLYINIYIEWIFTNLPDLLKISYIYIYIYVYIYIYRERERERDTHLTIDLHLPVRVQDSVAHSSGVNKTVKTFSWTAPSPAVGHLYFRWVRP